jgi:hypothetical protein
LRLTSVPAQYGSIAVAPDGARLAYVRGAPGLAGGMWLSNETEFDLVVREGDGSERRITGISGHALEYANIAGKIPPSVMFAADGATLYFTEFVGEDLLLKRIGRDGRGETVLYRFPNAVAAVPSPDLAWIAVREYQRSFLVPWSYAGQPVVSSPAERTASAVRVDAEDGGYLTWSADGATLGWTRASGFYEKPVAQMVAESRTPRARNASESWTGARVPGSTAQRTELGITFEIERPQGVVALTGARIITMNARREVLDNATIIIDGGRITALGTGLAVPAGAKVFDARGQTIIPGLIDAHAHPHIEHSTLHVIEQQPTYLSAPLAYGVTTVVEVYGNEYRDGWLTDMLRAGTITGPRFFTTGSTIFGTRSGFRRLMFRPIATLDDAREQLRWNKDHGAIAVKDYAQSIRLRRSLTITAARELGLNVLSESSGDPQMNFTQLLDGVTGIEHSMGLHPFHDDVVQYWGGTKAGMTPTLLVGYNVPMGEGWYHQASKLWEDPKLTRFITPEQLMRVRSPRAPVARGHGGAHDGERTAQAVPQRHLVAAGGARADVRPRRALGAGPVQAQRLHPGRGARGRDHQGGGTARARRTARLTRSGKARRSRGARRQPARRHRQRAEDPLRDEERRRLRGGRRGARMAGVEGGAQAVLRGAVVRGGARLRGQSSALTPALTPAVTRACAG